MIQIRAIMMVVLTFSTLIAFAEECSLLSQIEGEWHSVGTAFGKPAKITMTWEAALDDQFFRLDYQIRMQQESDKIQVFQGTAYYKKGGGIVFDAFWADNSGDLHPITVTCEDNALVAHWGVEGSKQGRTRYELLAAGHMEVTDFIKTPEKWRQFSRNSFSRVLD